MTEIHLDPDQDRVATAPASSRQVVTAGPGSGKSHVVGERCRYLVEEGLYPDQILVLSFSNAAVGVVRSRTVDVVDAGQGVTVSTLDALARRILEHDGEAADLSFDAVIRGATRALQESSEPLLDDVRHLIVDEVQDVVGIRARFLGDLLTKGLDPGAGFTLLGDPLQGIYDFQITQKDPWTSESLLDVLRCTQAPVQVELRGQYRALRGDAALGAAQRTAMLTSPPNQQMILARGTAANLSPLGPLDDEAVEMIRRWSGTTALLCDTNARAALTSDLLASLGLANELQGRATDPLLTPDIARILADHPSSVIDRETFRTRGEERGVADPDGLWRELTRVTDSWRHIDIRDLALKLGSARIPRSLLRQPDGRIRVSTVHRAKGLEFDNVVLVDHDAWAHGGDERAEARVLFVALSRARSKLTTASGCSLRRWGLDKKTGVWRRAAARGRGTTAIVLEPNHITSTQPVPGQPADVAGRGVDWIPIEHITDEAGAELPCWVLTIDGHEISRTTADFGRYIRAITSDDRRPAIQGGRLDGVMTVTGSPQREGAGKNGLWLGGRVSGPVYFEWERR